MYYVVNETPKKITFGWEVVEPNEKLMVSNNILDTRSTKDEDLGVCKIRSLHGEHSCVCYGNITCTPEKGKDGTVFTICQK